MLTVFAIEKAKPRERPYMLSDGLGLHVLVMPQGSKLWRFRYRFAGKQLMLSFGSFPEISVVDAREKRDHARKLIAARVNPSEKRKDDKREAEVAAANTFGAIAAEYLERLKAKHSAEATIEKNRWLLEDLAQPIAAKPIKEITSADILAVLLAVEKSGRRESARRLRGVIGSVFRHAIATLRAEIDPTYALRGSLLAPVVRHHPGITDEVRLGALWASIAEYDGWPTVKAGLQLCALTMSRPVEVRRMRRVEINFVKELWTVPPGRMKMREPHVVPLSRQALAVLREIWDLSPGSDLVLPSIRSSKKPLSENAFNSALRRMGYSQNEHCTHGFRTSASTILNERGYDAELIEFSLSHQDEDEVRAAYNRAKYLEPRRKLLQDWADLLDQFQEQARHAA
jgi:integrase